MTSYLPSQQIHKIRDDNTDLREYISLDEGFLDVTGSEHLFGGANTIGHEFKRSVTDETELICSVGISYSMMSAKLASEEKKPDGFFEILTPEALHNLIIDRSVRTIYGVGTNESSITTQQIADTLGIDVKNVDANILALKKVGIIEREGSKKKGRWGDC